MQRIYRVVGIREGERFVAQALEVDVFARGQSFEEALDRLKVTLAQSQESLDSGLDIFDVLGPAPQHFHELYERDLQCRETLII